MTMTVGKMLRNTKANNLGSYGAAPITSMDTQ